MSYQIVTGASGEPVSLSEVKEYMRVNHTDQDVMISSLLASVRERIELYLGSFLLRTTIREYYDCIPSDWLLMFSPVSEVTEVKYYDSTGVLQTLSNTVYDVDLISIPARMGLKPGQSWPGVQTRMNAVQILYKSGYADAASVPMAIKQAIKEATMMIYNNPEDEHIRDMLSYFRSRKSLDDYRTHFFTKS